jgi:hypothetical protein
MHSAYAFIDWLESEDEVSSFFRVVANSSKITLNEDCEPFNPPQDVDELLALGDESVIGPLCVDGRDPLDKKLDQAALS